MTELPRQSAADTGVGSSTRPGSTVDLGLASPGYPFLAGRQGAVTRWVHVPGISHFTWWTANGRGGMSDLLRDARRKEGDDA